MAFKLPDFLWWLPFGPVTEIEPENFLAWLKEGRPVQVVDARTGVEFNQGTIQNAKHAPVTEMPGAMKDLKLDQNRPVVVLCASGHRSRPGTRWLRAQGYEAYSLAGGIMNWQRAGHPLHRPSSKG